MSPVGCHNCAHAIYPDRQAYIAFQPGQSYLVSCPQNPGQRRVLMTAERPAAPVCPHHLEAA